MGVRGGGGVRFGGFGVYQHINVTQHGYISMNGGKPYIYASRPCLYPFSI